MTAEKKVELDERLKDKVIVITGASSGFGRGAALEFARNGAHLALAARREDLLNEVVEKCRQLGTVAIGITADVSKTEDIDRLHKETMAKFGHIDVWINNAAGSVIGRFTEVPFAEHAQVIQTDLIGLMYGSYLAMKEFENQGYGNLINVASIIGKIPAPYYPSYAAAKHGVVGFNGALRQELSAQKETAITVCTLMPMAMDTPFFEHAANYTGHKAVPVPPLDDADKVVAAMVKLAVEPEDEVAVGTGGNSNILMHNLVPGVSEAMMATLTHQAQMEKAPPEAPSPGSLREPSATGRGVKDAELAKKVK
jgi:short-subunit dehydrogenase